uniref:Uncharacterized protein n=1 Tax=Panagrolaimus davidi TaxID=227884 RepID=A0A914QLA0_9BILA
MSDVGENYKLFEDDDFDPVDVDPPPKFPIPFKVHRVGHEEDDYGKPAHEYQYKTKRVFKFQEFGVKNTSPYKVLFSIARRFLKVKAYKKYTTEFFFNSLILGIDAHRVFPDNNKYVLRYLKNYNNEKRWYLYRGVTRFKMHSLLLIELLEDREDAATTFFNLECFDGMDLKLIELYYLCSNFDRYEHFVHVLVLFTDINEEYRDQLLQACFELYGLEKPNNS